MSIFGSIVSAIFGTAKSVADAVTGGSTAAAAAAKTMTRDEVETMIQAVADKTGHKDYNWGSSGNRVGDFGNFRALEACM